ncbi:MAG: hypothetical protein K1X74_00470 [Pirellulales bacterium]|nr:hypothetical protein [Pirellulales bacterium]
MKLNRTSAVVEYKLLSNFERLRRVAAERESTGLLDKPLAFWVLPKDRRLPLAFMNRTVKDLLGTPFEDLYATPGVGQKKIRSLIGLLQRAVQEEPLLEPIAPAAPVAPAATEEQGAETFDASAISESAWALWRQTVVRHDLGDEPLGRYATTLADLPKVVWQTPLSTYTGLSLAEIRDLKTHGEKRIAAVLEVFHNLYLFLGHVTPQATLAPRIVPQFVNRIENWLYGRTAHAELPTAETLRTQIIDPLLQQARIDLGDQVADLAARRLGVSGDELSVRDAAKELGLTRARVYQMLADLGAMMQVRWPEGHAVIRELATELVAGGQPHSQYESFLTFVELFFPQKRGILHETLAHEHLTAPTTPHRQAG